MSCNEEAPTDLDGIGDNVLADIGVVVGTGELSVVEVEFALSTVAVVVVAVVVGGDTNSSCRLEPNVGCSFELELKLAEEVAPRDLSSTCDCPTCLVAVSDGCDGCCCGEFLASPM